MRVAIIGATGETGGSILRGLLACPEAQYHVTALVRPESLHSAKADRLRERGVEVRPIDITGPEADMEEQLRGVETLISAIHISQIGAQRPGLVGAAKRAGVSRFVPCHWGPVMPPKGVHVLQDVKTDVLNHVKRLRLPFTVVDVGWWFQLSLPRLPSGRSDYWHPGVPDVYVGRGDAPSALTDLDDVGTFVARIIRDPRTLNRCVFAYAELRSQESVYQMMERISGESIPRNILSAEGVVEIQRGIDPSSIGFDSPEFFKAVQYQYWHSWGVRGDNNPDYATYLGYLLAKDLYPDLAVKSLETFASEVADGRARRFYEEVKF